MTLADKFPPNEYICDGKIFLWYFEPTSHDILNPMPMVYQTPYARYIEPPAYVLLTSYPWYIEPLPYILIRNEGVQNTMGVQFTMNEIWPLCQYTIGFKIPNGTGTTTCVHLLNLLTNI